MRRCPAGQPIVRSNIVARFRWAACGAVMLLPLVLAACDPGAVVLQGPGTPPSVPTLRVRAWVDTPYVDVAAALAWTAGVPGVAVKVHLMTEPYDPVYWQEATADSSGLATFVDLLAGLYEVALVRRLTAAEAARANGVRILGGGRRLWLPVRDAQDVTMAPDRRGSLVFGELSMDKHPAVNYLAAGDAKYFEVHNNGDSTIYLDRKYWGIAWQYVRDYTPQPCVSSEAVRNDPDGIWATWLFRFPGHGSDYPLAPGATAVVARAAIDHRAVDPRLLDLSGAAFEWGGEATPDNPDVPNLEQIGPSVLPAIYPLAGGMPAFLSEGVDLVTLPRYVDPYSGSVYVRIPTALVLDAVSFPYDWTSSTAYTPPPACLEDLHRTFERLPGPAAGQDDYEAGVSFQRRVLTILPDGRKVLQDTDTSMEDFVKAPRTPGWVPDSLGH